MLEFRHPDDPEPLRFPAAPPEIVQAIQRRFESRPVVRHRDEPDVFIYDPGNFWDGATHVKWMPEIGHFHFRGWSGEEMFPLVGPLQ